MAWCLLGQYADKFLQMLRAGEIDPVRLANMSSAERHAFFAQSLGEQNALRTNALFESKLLLKNQQQGIVSWAKQTAGLKPELKRDILSRVQRMEKVLQPEEVDLFLNDLANQRLGMGVSFKEASNLTKLAKAVSDKKGLMGDDFTFPSESNRSDYGRARVAFSNYANDLKARAEQMTVGELAKQPIKVVTEVGGVAKATKASMDNSSIFRQGWKLLWTHPTVWSKNALKSFNDIWRTFGKKAVMDELNADIVSRPNALNGKYKAMGLDLNVLEEAYPTHLPGKVPGLGRAYKASETAFTAFVRRSRADVADLYLDIAQKSGVDITSKIELEAMGKMVNSLTSRGHLGRLEPAAGVVNNVFFSPRLLKSTWDILTAHQFQKGVTPFVRKRAAINLLKIISGTAAILTIADAVRPGSVEWNTLSADFGKVRVGNTRFDVTGGMGSLVVLSSRMAQNSFKSSVTGKVEKLGQRRFGAKTRLDMVYNFFENKLSPLFSVVKNLLKGRTFEGKKPTVLGEATNLFEPMIFQTGRELVTEEDSADFVVSILAEALGISVTTYKSYQKVK